MFPNKITSFGVHTDDAFLFINAFSDPANDINLVVHHNRSRAATHIGFLPKDIFSVIRQACLA